MLRIICSSRQRRSLALYSLRSSALCLLRSLALRPTQRLAPCLTPSFALAVALILSGCLEPLALTATAQSVAKKKTEAPRPATFDTRSQVIYSDKGPLVRIALVTDVNTVAISSDSELAIRRSLYEKPVFIAGNINAEIRQSFIAAEPPPSSSTVATSTPHRVEVSVSKDPQQAKRITENVKSKYDQTASTLYDNKTGEYRVVTGKFSSRNQANDMAALLREAGYGRARAIPVQVAGATAANASVGKTKPTAYKTQPSAKESIDVSRLARGPQLVAFDAENLISSSDKLLIISPVESSREKVLESRKPSVSPIVTTKPLATDKKQPSSGSKTTAKPATKTTAKKAQPKATKSSPAKTAAKTSAKSTAKPQVTANKSQAKPQSKPDAYRRGAYTAISEAPDTVRVGKHKYRGEIHLTLNERGRINVVNVLPLEEYLRGVVPLELSPSIARLEALKAQAVAARSYAIANLGRFRDEGFDLRDDQRSQVYGGFTSEHATTNRAVEETRGVVALTFNESGRAVPIEALYSANCGGRTENNENIFQSRAISYLRSVECPMDSDFASGREITSSAGVEPLKEPFGHALARDLALLSALGFALPGKVTNDYLKDSVERGELQKWAERAAKLTRERTLKITPVRYESSRTGGANADAEASDTGFDIGHEIAVLKSQKRDITKLPGFATLVALVTYGEHRESQFMPESEASYLLAGLGAEEAPKESRADLALLIKEGILRLHGDGRIDAKRTVKRGYAVEILARAISFNAKAADLKLQTATAIGADTHTLIINSATNATQAARARRQAEPVSLEVEKHARLFRVLGEESYSVDRLSIRGNERVTYHLNDAGRIDFLEVEPAKRDDSSNQVADDTKWSESFSKEEIRRRLMRARLDVGEVTELAATGFGASRRVVEIEVVGSEKTIQLRGGQIRTIFGLKDNPLVIERERDARGQTANYIFTGTGFGHGVGMCQIGAARMAKHGHSYVGILQRYYTGVSVQKIY